jgi:quercetin dioxygenase-like cupin family protein
MKSKTKVVIGVAATIIAGVVVATPLINLTSPVVAAGNVVSKNLNVSGVAKDLNDNNYFNVSLTTQGRASISSQVASFNPGGENGWHSHPGLVTVMLTKGSIVWYNGNCEATTYNAGDAWAEGSQVHMFRVVSKEAVLIYATFITAQGEALRTDKPEPPCAAAMGLN